MNGLFHSFIYKKIVCLILFRNYFLIAIRNYKIMIFERRNWI